MNTNSNSYTIIYASVMVVIVAFLLAFVSSSLRETQNKNVQLDTKKQILAALNIKNVEDADAEYQKYVKGDMLMNVDGTLTENTGEFATNYEKEAKEQQRLHVFVCEVDGQTKYVVPVYGAGLWGAIWGYVALNEDKDTVYVHQHIPFHIFLIFSIRIFHILNVQCSEDLFLSVQLHILVLCRFQ